MSNGRIKWIDFTKGIGILLVVYVHATFYSGFYFSKWINSFFMPLFFICAGLVFSSERFGIRKTAEKILGAYYFWGILGLLFGTCVDIAASSFSFLGFGKNALYFLLGMNPYYNSPLWFLPALFVAKLCYWLICRISKNRLPVKILLVLLFSSAGVVINLFREGFYLPYRFDIGMAMIGFIFIGEISKDLLVKWSCFKKGLVSLLCALSLSVSLLFGLLLNGEVSVDAGTFSFYPWLIISGCAGTLFLITAGMLLTYRENILGKAVCWMGYRSLTVQCSHFLVLYVLSVALLFVSLPTAVLYCIKYAVCVLIVILICYLADYLKKYRQREKIKNA